jgi:ribose-phosphate pyrophosphokinase
VVLNKTRTSDRCVELIWPDISRFQGKTPVLIDDIASSGATLIAAAEGVSARGFAKPYCAVVHALLNDEAFARLQQVCARVVSTDSVTHVSNAMGLAPLIATL